MTTTTATTTNYCECGHVYLAHYNTNNKGSGFCAMFGCTCEGYQLSSIEQPRPEQAGGSASICECSHPRSEHVLSTGPRDRCSGTTERGTPCGCPKFTLRKGDDDAPAAPERGEWQVLQTTPGESRSVFDSERRLIANVISGELAHQIVTEHNQHSTLVAQRERLLEVLREMLNRFYPHTCDRGPNCAKCKALLAANGALTTIEQEGTR